MRKLQLLILLLLSFTAPVTAQLAVVGSSEYGRIFDVTYDDTIPGKLYAATLGNHIVVSLNNGSSWELLYSYPQKGSIIKELKLMPGKKLAFRIYNNGNHSRDVHILDIPSLAIERTFQIPVPASATGSYVSAYNIYAADTDIAIVQQYYEENFALKAKVYYTGNGGNSWSEIYDNTLHDFIFPSNVAISPDNPQKLFIARIGGLDPGHIGGLLISQNAGEAWEQKLPGIDFNPMAFSPVNSNTMLMGTAVGSQVENLYQSFDGGESWSVVNETWNENVSGAVIAIKYNPANADNIIILAGQDIITTSDGLQNLQFHHHEEGIHNPEGDASYYYGTNASFNPFINGQIFISANYFPLFTTDGGATVTRAKQPYFSSPEFTAIVSAAGQSHLYYGVQNGYIHKDMATLVETPAFIYSLGMFSNYSTEFFIDAQLPGRTYNFSSSFMGAGLNISNDHGLTYLQVPVDNPYMQAVASHLGNPNQIWYAASDYSGVSSLFELNISDPANPQQQPIALPEEGTITAMYFSPVSPEEKLIALGTHIYKYEAVGPAWESLSTGLESLESGIGKIFQIAQNPLVQNEKALATSQGIFVSQDAGTTWQQSDAFPHDGVNLLAYSPVSAGQRVAITYDTEYTGFTIRCSADAGQSWIEIPAANLAHISSYSATVQFGIDTATIYISTSDLGLISYTVSFTDLGAGDNSGSRSFVKLYPNPADDFISLQLDNESLSGAAVFSVTGQKIMESNDTTIDVSSLQNGMYFVKIKTVSGKVVTRKFIKI
jgi:xyloglucan-specific exo-beta-1,4-glucanase